MKDNKVYLQHILDSIDKIKNYISDVSREEFLSEPGMLQDAIIRQLEIMGEAAKNIPDDFKKQHPQVVWRKAVGMRNRITHEYFMIDYETVWDTINNDLPRFRDQIRGLLG